MTAEGPVVEDCLEWTIREWIQYHQDHIVTSRTTYRGVPCWKNVMDLWVYQEIINETRPEVVVEIGVKHGGTTWWLADTLAVTVGEGTSVVAIDINLPSNPLPPSAVMLHGNSLAPEIIERATGACRGRRTMVIADGSHAADHVLGELRTYGPMVTPGCYFIVEDGVVDVMDWTQFTPGPMVAADRFVAESGDFEVDRSRERFVLTYAPRGFLRRV